MQAAQQFVTNAASRLIRMGAAGEFATRA